MADCSVTHPKTPNHIQYQTSDPRLLAAHMTKAPNKQTNSQTHRRRGARATRPHAQKLYACMRGGVGWLQGAVQGDVARTRMGLMN